MMIHKILLGLGILVPLLAVYSEPIRIEKSDVPRIMSENIPVDPAKNWEFTADIQGDSDRLDIFLYQYDQKERRIGPFHLNAVKGTETPLTIPAEQGGQSFIVADASKWDVPAQGNIVVFDAKADLSDLPNFQIEYYVSKVTRQENGFLVEMNRPLSRSYAAGTLVRLHQDGGHLGWSLTLPAQKEFRQLIEAAVEDAAPPNHMWKGAAFVRLAVNTDSPNPVTLTKWDLREVPQAEMDRRRNEEQARLLAEKQKITPYGYSKILKSGADEEEFTNCFFLYKGERHYWSGISQSNLELPCSEIGQFECDIKASTPGFLELALSLNATGKDVSINLPPQSIIPDGEYRRFIFTPAEAAAWDPSGKLTSWSIRFREYQDINTITGFRNPEFKRESNLIAGADKLLPGQPAEIPGLRPLGKYRLNWRDGNCPGATLEFFDHLMQPVPESRIRLAPGQNECEFTAPEKLILGKIILDGQNGWPQLVTESYRRRYTPELYWRGQWIWLKHTLGPNYANVWFYKEFDLQNAPEYAAFAVMADDVSDTQINGVYVGQTWPYRVPKRFDITKLLKPGRNRIAIRVYNLDQQAGLCAEIYLKTAKEDQWIITDSSWLCQETGQDKNLPEKFESHAVELGDPATTAPWAASIGFAYVGPRGIFTLKNSENGQFTATLINPVISSFRTLKFERRSESGKKDSFLLPASMTENADGTVTVKYPKLRPTEEKCTVFLDDEFWEIAGNAPLAKLEAKPLSVPALQKAEFIDVGTRTRLKFNGKIYDPTFYLSSEWERLTPAIDAGFNSFLVDARFEEFWLGHGKYDFSKLDQNVEVLLTVAPEAIFMLDIRFYMPEWWLKENPDDTSKYFEDGRRNTYDDLQALGSKKWLADSEAPLTALIDHVKKSYWADRVWSANIGDSRGNEWFWGGATAGRDRDGKPAQPGYSPGDLAAFRTMLRRIYGTDEALANAWQMPGVQIDSAPMPDHKLRRIGAVGSLLSPETNRQIMDWCLFRNQSLAEALIFFGKSIKERTDRKWLTGGYYGYMTELSDNPGRSQLITGHNGFLDCAKSPDLDFFRAPSRYSYRKTGMPNCVMQTPSTFSLRGKVVYIENDERNAYGPREDSANDMYVGRSSTALEAVGHFNREFAMFSTLGIAQYWLDHIKGSLYEPALMSVIAEQLKAYQSLPPVQNLTPAEIAVVGDVQSIYYSVDGKKGIFPPAISGVFKRLNYLGVPFRNLVIADLLEKGLTPAHKLYIMLPTLVLSQQDRVQLRQRFEQENATVLWLYSAGSSYPDRGPKSEFCGDFLDLKFSMTTSDTEETLQTKSGIYTSIFTSAPHFYPESGYNEVLGSNADGRPVLVLKTLNGARHLFSTLPDLPKETLAELITSAGVFRFTENQTDPLWIGNDLVFVYVATGGNKQIILPEGLHMKAIIGPLKGEFRSGQSWNATAGLVYGFLVY